MTRSTTHDASAACSFGEQANVSEAVTPSALNEAMLSTDAEWVDAFEPQIPAEPTGFGPWPAAHPRRPVGHKLILMGMALGATALTAGFCGASVLM
jgi:hypothetical protein